MAFSLLERFVLILRTILYGIIVISSFLVFGALASSMNKAQGMCLLFVKKEGKPPEKSTCDFSIVIAVIFCLVFPVIVIVVTILTFIGILKDKLMSLTFVHFLLLVVWDAVSAIFVLVAASIISAGFKQTCDTIISLIHELHDVPENLEVTCSLLIETTNSVHIDTPAQAYFSSLIVAQGGAWTAFVCYLVQVLSGVLVLCVMKRRGGTRKPTGKKTQESVAHTSVPQSESI